MNSFVIGAMDHKQIGQQCQGLLDEMGDYHENVKYLVLDKSDVYEWMACLMATNKNPEELQSILNIKFRNYYRVQSVNPTP